MKSWVQILSTHLKGTEGGEIPWSCLVNQVSRIAKLWLHWELLFQKIKCFLVTLESGGHLRVCRTSSCQVNHQCFPGDSHVHCHLRIPGYIALLSHSSYQLISGNFPKPVFHSLAAHWNPPGALRQKYILLDLVDLRFDLCSRLSRLPVGSDD